MNDRIKELADEAKAYCHETFQNTKSAEWMPYTQMYDKKFAELIVKECANQFKLVYTDEQYQRRIDKTILKHFGFYA